MSDKCWIGCGCKILWQNLLLEFIHRVYYKIMTPIFWPVNNVLKLLLIYCSIQVWNKGRHLALNLRSLTLSLRHSMIGTFWVGLIPVIIMVDILFHWPSILLRHWCHPFLLFRLFTHSLHINKFYINKLLPQSTNLLLTSKINEPNIYFTS